MILDDKIKLICPICKKIMFQRERTLVCEKNHCFDFARQGYVNLLPVQNKHSLNPGDTAEMLSARRDFLDKGFYVPILNDVEEAVQKYHKKEPLLVDVGCGEGYYTCMLKEKLSASCVGIDISKNGVRMACSRNKNILWLAATGSNIPLADSSADIVTAIFSLFMNDEYSRILKSGGCFVEVCAASKHLIQLKEIIYDEVFEQHKHPAPCGREFDEVMCEEHGFDFELENSDLRNLLLMTPHFWRIKKERREKLENIKKLHLSANYWVRVLVKK